MSDSNSIVSVRRLVATVAVALVVAASAVVAALLTPFRFDGATQPSRLGAIHTTKVEKDIAGDLARAARFYGQLSRIDPDPRHRQTAAEAQFLLGEYFENTDPDRALESFRASTGFLDDYRHGWPWFKMGSLLAAAGRDGEADDHFARAMQIDDGYLSLLAGYERGKIAVRRGQPDQAWDFFYTFLRFYPHPIAESQFRNMLGNGAVPVGRGLYVVGRSLPALGKFQEARPLLLEFVREFPDDASGRFYAARAGSDVRKPDSVGTDLLRTDPRLSADVKVDRDGAVFFSSGRLMFDVYVTEDETPVSLRVVADRRAEEPELILTILVNAQTLPDGGFKVPHQPKVRWEPRFSLRPGHNIVEVALQSFPATRHRNTPVLRIPSLLLLPDGAL